MTLSTHRKNVFWPILTVCVAITTTVSSCALDPLSDQPSSDAYSTQFFNVDNAMYSFKIAEGGTVGQYNIFSLDTSTLDSEFQILFSWSYDSIRNSVRWHDFTNLLFGVSRNDGCGFECISEADDSTNQRPTRIERLVVRGGPAIRKSWFASDGDFVEQYFLPLDDECSFFFTLRIYAEKADDSGFRVSRQALLEEVVWSFLKSSATNAQTDQSPH
jgi:hypothetical protein